MAHHEILMYYRSNGKAHARVLHDLVVWQGVSSRMGAKRTHHLAHSNACAFPVLEQGLEGDDELP